MTTINAGDVVTASEINQWCPPGMVTDYAGSAAPTGWLLCDGASYLRATYPALFTAIGTTYGAADGTHFNVPDCRGRIPVGYAASGGHTDVATLGANDGVAAASRRPKHRTTNALGASSFSGTTGNDSPDHTHSTDLWVSGAGGGPANIAMGNNNSAPVADGAAVSSGASARHTHSFSGSTSAPTGSIGTNVGADPIDTPAYIVLNKIIRAQDA